MKHLLVLAKRLDHINMIMASIAHWAILLMLGLGLWNVIGRYLGVAIGYNLSSNGLIEGQWYLFDLIFLFGMGWTLQRQGHVRVDVLQGRWGARRKAKIELLGTLLFLLPFAIGVAIISLEPALHSWSINEASPDPNGLPRYLIKTLIPIGFLLLALQGVSEAIKNLAVLRNSSFLHNDKRVDMTENNCD